MKDNKKPDTRKAEEHKKALADWMAGKGLAEKLVRKGEMRDG